MEDNDKLALKDLRRMAKLMDEQYLPKQGRYVLLHPKSALYDNFMKISKEFAEDNRPIIITTERIPVYPFERTVVV